MTAPAAPPQADESRLGVPNAEPQGRRPAFLFETVDIPPPAPLYLGPADRLRFFGVNLSAAGTRIVSIAGRMLLPDGSVQTFNFDVPLSPATSGIWQDPFDLGECVLLNVGAFAFGALHRQCYVTLIVQRGDTPAAGQLPQIPEGVLVSGYLSGSYPLAWPASKTVEPDEGRGKDTVVTVTVPAAGADWTDTFGNQVNRKVKLVSFTLTTSAVVANRQVGVEFVQGATVVHRAGRNVNQPASTAQDYMYAEGANDNQGLDLVTNHAALPRDFLCNGVRTLRSATLNLQAADQFSNIHYNVEDFAAF